MNVTRRGRAALLTATLVLSAGAGATAQHWDPIARDAQHASLCPAGSYLASYEDGSGACYANGTEAQFPIIVHGAEVTFPEGTFPWNCHTDGNRVCGSDLP